MLTQLRFSNFKSWADDNRVDFGRITGLFGPNSSGKSAILQTLLLLKQTAETGDDKLILNFGGARSDYADFGSYIDLVHKRDPTRKLSLSMTWTGPDPAFRQSMGSEYSLDIELSAGKRRNQEQVKVDRLEYVSKEGGTTGSLHGSTVRPRVFEDDLKIELSRPSPTALGYKVRLRSGDTVKIDLPIRRKYEPQGALRIPRAALDDLYVAATKARKSNDNSPSPQWLIVRLHFEPRESITKFLRHVYYLGPLREYPHRNYQWTGTLPATVGQRGEWAVQTLLADQSGDRSSRKRTRSSNGSQTENQLSMENVQKWLHKLGVAENIDLRRVGEGARIWELMLSPPNVAGYEANIADVGFGVSQVLPVVVELLNAPRGSTVLLEHPEIHLHPKVQMDLVDFFIYAAKERGIQIVFESHSEYMLARLQRRLAESNGSDSPITTDDVKLYFCSLKNDRSVLDPLKVNPNGSIQNWPEDFFGDTFTERMAIAKANVSAGS